MELSRDKIESFKAAYKLSYGEDLSYKEAFEIAHRLVAVFQLLEKAEKELAHLATSDDEVTE